MKAVEPQPNTGEGSSCPPIPPSSSASAAVRSPAAGACWCAFAPTATACSRAAPGEPLARLRLTGNGDEVVLLYPSHRGGWGALGDFGASAMSLDKALQCLSDNPYFLELRETYG